MTKPTKFFKWVVKLRMWYADIEDTMVRNGIMNLVIITWGERNE